MNTSLTFLEAKEKKLGVSMECPLHIPDFSIWKWRVSINPEVGLLQEIAVCIKLTKFPYLNT